MIFAMSSLVKGTVERQFFVLFKRISRKLGSIVDYSALFIEETIKDLSILFKICNVIIIMIY